MSEIKEKQEVEKVVGYRCDICGHECPHGEHATLHAQWGYDSHKDGEIHECHICEKCYDAHIVTLIKRLKGKIRWCEYDLLSSERLGEIDEDS